MGGLYLFGSGWVGCGGRGWRGVRHVCGVFSGRRISADFWGLLSTCSGSLCVWAGVFAGSAGFAGVRPAASAGRGRRPGARARRPPVRSLTPAGRGGRRAPGRGRWWPRGGDGSAGGPGTGGRWRCLGPVPAGGGGRGADPGGQVPPVRSLRAVVVPGAGAGGWWRSGGRPRWAVPRVRSLRAAVVPWGRCLADDGGAGASPHVRWRAPCPIPAGGDGALESDPSRAVTGPRPPHRRRRAPCPAPSRQ